MRWTTSRRSLRALALKPEILLLGHGMPVKGNAEITKQLTKTRDAVLYVHDAVVRGMNEGKDVFTLMREIHLPPALALDESFGRVSWAVRGIYDGYAGWFDMNPSTMYETPATAVYGNVVRLAGGPAAITQLALERIRGGKPAEALHLTDIALAADTANRGALEARLKALQMLLAATQNRMEMGWLNYGIRDAKKRLGMPPCDTVNRLPNANQAMDAVAATAAVRRRAPLGAPHRDADGRRSLRRRWPVGSLASGGVHERANSHAGEARGRWSAKCRPTAYCWRAEQRVHDDFRTGRHGQATEDERREPSAETMCDGGADHRRDGTGSLVYHPVEVQSADGFMEQYHDAPERRNAHDGCEDRRSHAPFLSPLDVGDLVQSRLEGLGRDAGFHGDVA